jgi:hypothetical protein
VVAAVLVSAPEEAEEVAVAVEEVAVVEEVAAGAVAVSVPASDPRRLDKPDPHKAVRR